MSSDHVANFDERPPSIPVDDYDVRVRMMNPGYELVFELAVALLRAHCPEKAQLLLAGGGGSTEVRAFAAAGPRWQLTVVDPSAEMLERARVAAEADGLTGRVQFLQATPDDLPPEACFDAATAIFVLMHLPDDGAKLELLQGIAGRLKPGAPLILVDSIRDQRERFAPPWLEFSVTRGASAEDMTAFFERIAAKSNTTTEARELELLAEAGFRDATRFFAAFTMNGWIATR